MLKWINSEYSVFMFPAKKQPRAKCLGNNLTGTFSLKGQSWRDPHSSMKEKWFWDLRLFLKDSREMKLLSNIRQSEN